MALPSLDKTWQYDINQTFTSTGVARTDHEHVLLAFKNSLIGFANNPWTVVSSSNASSSGAADYWTTIGDLTWANSPAPHSWIVLEQTGIGPAFQMCIELPTTSFGDGINLIMSTAGFTGGDINNRPSHVDEIILPGSQWFGGGGINTFNGVLHVMQSTDGQCTRMLGFNTIISGGAKYRGMWAIDKAKNPVAGWSVPIVFVRPTISGVYPNYVQLNGADTWSYGDHNGEMKFYLTSEFYSTDALGERILALNDIDNSWMMAPIGLYSKTTGKRGRHGMLYDIWWGSSAIPSISTYPSGSSRQFLQFGDLIFPWDGSVVLT